MKKLVFGIVFAVFCAIGSYAQLVNTKSFTNDKIGRKFAEKYVDYIDWEHCSLDPDTIYRFLSPDTRYAAFDNKSENIIITDKRGVIIFFYQWDDEYEKVGGDCVDGVGWSSDSRFFWFVSFIEYDILYIAKVDMHRKQLEIYKKQLKCNPWYAADTDKGIFYYDDHVGQMDKDDGDQESCYAYRVSTDKTQKLLEYEKIKGKYECTFVYDDKTPFKPSHVVATNDGSKLRLRVNGNTISAQIGSLANGTAIEILARGAAFTDNEGRAGHWVLVDTGDGDIGWVFGGYLKAIK
jgi:hypothetical protein